MQKMQIFGKTQRLGISTYQWLLTEKLDGSNLCLLKRDDTLYIAQRKIVMALDETDEHRDVLYKGLYEWLQDYGHALEEELYQGSAICGEWLGTGKIKYPDTFPRFNMFAKARISADGPDGIGLTEFDYDPASFHCVFASDRIPDCIGVVPVIAVTLDKPTVEMLDAFYNAYVVKVNHPVEGIVITQKEVPECRCKYVRMKNGKLGPHVTAEEMEARRIEGMARAAERRAQRNA